MTMEKRDMGLGQRNREGAGKEYGQRFRRGWVKADKGIFGQRDKGWGMRFVNKTY